jgi:flavodoxin
MKILVVYYSRSGVTRKTSEKLAEVLRAASHEVTVEEIQEKKKRSGFFGYLAAGFAAMRKKAADIEPVKADVASFDLVAIGTPVWAWTAATPVRAFCGAQGKDAKQVAFFATMGGSGDKGTYKAMGELTGKQPVATMTLIDRHVKKEDAQKFISKVQAFAEEMTTSKEKDEA